MEGFVQAAQWKIDPVANTPSSAVVQSPIDDQHLLRQLARGNEAAFEALYARYQGPIYRFALHMSGNTASAEEITQEVFMTVIGKPRAYDPAKGTVAGYLFGIARNLMRRSLQQSRRDVPLGDEDGGKDEFQSDANLLENLSRSESLKRLRRAVLALPEDYREVVVLCELEEMSYPEAASVLKCAPGTIASRLHRAKAMLQEKLKGLACRSKNPKITTEPPGRGDEICMGRAKPTAS